MMSVKIAAEPKRLYKSLQYVGVVDDRLCQPNETESRMDA